MKNFKNYLSIAIIASLGLFVASCSTTINVAKKKHGNGYYVNISKSTETSTATPGKKKRKPTEVVQAETKQSEQVIVSNSTPRKKAKTTNNVVKNVVSTVAVTAKTNQGVNKSGNKATKKKQTKKSRAVAKATSNKSADDRTLLLIILAILLPPVAVFLVKGLNIEFWISLLLTLLIWVPGVIYALLIVFGMI